MRERILHIKAQDIYRIVQAALLFCILLFGLGDFWGVSDVKKMHLLIAFIVLAAALGMQKLTKKGRFFCFLSLLFVLLITGMTFGVGNCLLFLSDYGRWLLGTGAGEPDRIAGYIVLQVIFAAVFCYILQCILEKYFLLKMALLCMLVCMLLFCLLTERTLHHAGVVFALTYIVMAGGEWIEYYWDKEKNTDRKVYMLWIMPFMALYVLFMLWMPAPAKPFEWQFAKNAFSQMQESFITLTQNIMRGEDENFDTALSGFPEDGELQGDLEEEQRVVMIVEGEDDLVSNVYLAGRVYDTFDGRQWYQENDNITYDIFADTAQTRSAVEQYQESYLKDYLNLTTLHIRYRYFNTAYVFVPLKTERILEGREELSFISSGGNLLFSDKDHHDADKRGYGTEYDVSFYQLNAGSWDFEDFLLSAQEEEAGDGIRQIYDVYSGEVPLSDEVRAYVDEITRYADSDIEKLRMIEAALSSCTYTRSPGKLPDTVKDAGSFLDYFLLESREGYCTYFATAFTLLARAEGIPARYVQGFCVPMENGKETAVYGDMGHSWPEVYIKGIGWIPFEPTPGYGQLRYSPWETAREHEAALDEAEKYGSYDQGDPAYGTEEGMSLVSIEENVAAAEENEARRAGIIGNVLKIAVYAVLTFAAAGLLFVLFERIIRKKRYRKMNMTKKFCAAVGENLRILTWLGLRRHNEETLQEFEKRAVSELGLSEKQLLFIEKYEALLYGGKDIDETAVREAGDEGKRLLLLLKEKKKRTYFYYRARVHFY